MLTMNGNINQSFPKISRQGAKYAKLFWDKNKINNEVLCDPCASARNHDVKAPAQADFTVMRK